MQRSIKKLHVRLSMGLQCVSSLCFWIMFRDYVYGNMHPDYVFGLVLDYVFGLVLDYVARSHLSSMCLDNVPRCCSWIMFLYYLYSFLSPIMIPHKPQVAHVH